MARSEGSRGTKEILTRYPEEKGIDAGERHEGIKFTQKPTKSDNTQIPERAGLNE